MLGNKTTPSDGNRTSHGNTNGPLANLPPLTEEEAEFEIYNTLKKESSNTHSLLEKLVFQPKQKSRL